MGKLIIRLGGGLPRIELVVMGGGGGGWFIMVAPYRQTVTSHMYCAVLGSNKQHAHKHFLCTCNFTNVLY